MSTGDGGRLNGSPRNLDTDTPEKRPVLPTRPKLIADPKVAEGDLIDFTGRFRGEPKPAAIFL